MNNGQQVIQVDLAKTTPVMCMCGNEFFEQVMYLRKLNRFISPTGKDEVIPVPVFRCIHCKTVVDQSEPDQKKKNI